MPTLEEATADYEAAAASGDEEAEAAAEQRLYEAEQRAGLEPA